MADLSASDRQTKDAIQLLLAASGLKVGQSTNLPKLNASVWFGQRNQTYGWEVKLPGDVVPAFRFASATLKEAIADATAYLNKRLLSITAKEAP